MTHKQSRMCLQVFSGSLILRSVSYVNASIKPAPTCSLNRAAHLYFDSLNCWIAPENRKPIGRISMNDKKLSTEHHQRVMPYKFMYCPLCLLHDGLQDYAQELEKKHRRKIVLPCVIPWEYGSNKYASQKGTAGFGTFRNASEFISYFYHLEQFNFCIGYIFISSNAFSTHIPYIYKKYSHYSKLLVNISIIKYTKLERYITSISK